MGGLGLHRRALLLGLALAVLASCGKDAEVADLNLILTPIAEPDPFGADVPKFKVASLELRGQVGSRVLFRSVVEYDQGAQSLPAVTIEDGALSFPVDDVTVVLSGFGADGSLVAQGSSAPLRLTASGTTTASLIFARADTCSRLAASLRQPRWGHSATLLPDGRVLVAGGAAAAADGRPVGALDSIEIFDLHTGQFTLTEGMSQAARVFHTATAVGGGVLLAGGLDADGAPLGTAVLFDPQRGSFGAEISIAPRAAHAASAQNGNVLVAGGVGPGAGGLGAIPGFAQLPGGLDALASAELIQIASSDTLPKPDLPGGARAFPAAAALGDGSAVVAGGVGPSGVSAAIDHYPGAGAPPVALDPLGAPRAGAAALSLRDNVLIAGGLGVDGSGVAGATLVLGSGPTVTEAPEMKLGRGGFGMARLDAESAVALGGASASEPSVSFAISAETYSASSGFTLSGNLRQPRMHAAVTRLIDGAVLVLGGLTPDGTSGELPALDSAEVFRARQELP